MWKRGAAILVVGLMASNAAAQDAKTAIANASKAMGTQNPGQGAYSALAVEFADHVLLYEPGPQSEARGLAIIAETKRVIYLPKEKILAYADMFNLPNEASSPVPDPPVRGSMVFADNIERLKLDVERIMSVHSLVPDRLTSVAEIRASLGRK